MPLVEDVADRLAKEALALMLKTGDETVEKRVADEIGSSSPTLQENFSTAMRIRKAEARALGLLKRLEKDAADRAARPAPPKPEPEPAVKAPKAAEEAAADAAKPAEDEIEFSDVIQLPSPEAPEQPAKQIALRKPSRPR